MLNDLRVHFPTLELGSYYHTTGSMHIYNRHYSMLDIDFEQKVPEHNKKYVLKNYITLQSIKENKLYLPKEDMSKEDLQLVITKIERELFI